MWHYLYLHIPVHLFNHPFILPGCYGILGFLMASSWVSQNLHTPSYLSMEYANSERWVGCEAFSYFLGIPMKSEQFHRVSQVQLTQRWARRNQTTKGTWYQLISYLKCSLAEMMAIDLLCDIRSDQEQIKIPIANFSIYLLYNYTSYHCHTAL